MKWIGQNIYDQISRFRNKVFFEGDVEFNTDTITFQSANADDPIVTIKNTSNAANDMASLKFVKDRGATPGVGDNLAEIYFIGEDADQNSQEYGRILCETDVVTGGQESGRLKLGVANHDGGNGYGLTIQGGSVNDEVDVTVGLGTASVTTIAGDLHVTTGLALDSVDVTAIQTSGESFADNDTSLMTSASINDRIESFGYTTNTGDITSVVAGTGLSGGGASGDVTLNASTASDSAKGIVELATTAETTAGTDAGRAVTPDGLKDGYRGSSNVTVVGTILTGEWQGTALATAYIADDAVTFAKASGVTPNVFGTYIKLIPSDFMANDDGGNTRLGIGYVDTAGADYGMRVSHNDTELFAFVSIPEGMKATHVEVFGKRAKAVEVFEVQINASTLTSKGTGTCGTPSDAIGDEEFALTSEVNSTATNLLAIEVTVTSNSADKVYGGRVKIAAI